MATRRTFDDRFKLLMAAIVLNKNEYGENMAGLASKFKVSSVNLYSWATEARRSERYGGSPENPNPQGVISAAHDLARALGFATIPEAAAALAANMPAPTVEADKPSRKKASKKRASKRTPKVASQAKAQTEFQAEAPENKAVHAPSVVVGTATAGSKMEVISLQAAVAGLRAENEVLRQALGAA